MNPTVEVSSMPEKSVNIDVVENGIIVRCSWDEGEGDKKQYKSETYVFPDFETASGKLNEMFPKNEKIQKKLKGLISQVTG